MSGMITTSINLPIEIHNEMYAVLKRTGGNQSEYMRKAIRELNFRERERNVKEILEMLSEREIEVMKKEIKKKGL